MSGAVVNLLKLRNFSIFEQLLLEEGLLRGTQKNWMVINQGTPERAVVMGLSGKPHSLLDVEAVRRDSIPVIKRFSGGGTVVVDESTIFVTLIGDDEFLREYKTKLYPREIMAWTETFYKRVFTDSDFRLREHDYVFGDKKFGGNAQCITRKRWLHHTSFLHDFKDKNMDYLLLPNSTPEYRAKRSHLDFLCRLNERYPNQNRVVSAITDAIFATMKERAVPGAVIEVDLEQAKKDSANSDHRVSTVLLDLTIDEKIPDTVHFVETST